MGVRSGTVRVVHAFTYSKRVEAFAFGIGREECSKTVGSNSRPIIYSRIFGISFHDLFGSDSRDREQFIFVMFLEMCYQSLSDVAAEPFDRFFWDYDEPILNDSFGIPLSLPRH